MIKLSNKSSCREETCTYILAEIVQILSLYTTKKLDFILPIQKVKCDITDQFMGVYLTVSGYTAYEVVSKQVLSVFLLLLVNEIWNEPARLWLGLLY